MKKLILFVMMVFGSITLMAQNQFRDYTEFKKAEFEKNRPQIEHKDGKVIIIMSEEQFKRMGQMRMGGRPMMGRPPMKPVMMGRGHQRCECNQEKKQKFRKAPKAYWK